MLALENGSQNLYWGKRSNMMYYQYVDSLVRALAKDAKSIIDIGSNDAQYIENFNWIPNKVTLDIENPYKSKNVKSIEMNFFDYQPDEKFDFLTCLQVLEHIPDVKQFARKLFDVSDRVLISVPYMWEAGATKSHIHDPVDLNKVIEWTGRNPDYHIIVKEPLDDTSKSSRLICYYHPEKEKINLKDARKIIRFSPNTLNNNTSSKELQQISYQLSSAVEQLKHNQMELKKEQEKNQQLTSQLTQLMNEKQLRDLIAEKERKLSELIKENDSLEESYLNKKGEYQKISNEYKEALNERKRLNKEYRKIKQSRSWKVTLIARKVYTLLKGNKLDK